MCVLRKNKDCVPSYRCKEVSRHAVWVQPSVRSLVEFDGPGCSFRRQFGEGAEEVARLGHALEPGVGAAFDDDQVLASLHPQLRHQLHPLGLGGDVRQGEGARHQVVLDLCAKARDNYYSTITLACPKRKIFSKKNFQPFTRNILTKWIKISSC